MDYRKQDLSMEVWKKMVQGMEKTLQNVVENQEERNQINVPSKLNTGHTRHPEVLVANAAGYLSQT